MSHAEPALDLHSAIAAAFAHSPLIGVVRTATFEEAERQARLFIAGGIRLVEITFTVPGATDLVRRLLAERGDGGYHVGMGTVTGAERARQALAAGAEFIVSPNVSREVADAARQAGVYVLLGATTPTEIVAARQAGADLVKVYPLPPLGGPAYLRVVRGPLGDVPMLAAGGFGPEEIPAYREAGAVAFGIGVQLLASSDEESLRRIAGALVLARSGGDAGAGSGA
jgi:2-dehydro-3-deoxyphosphogluconate aldolase / (4S)-4-hydroxy-2-oxoglutarate aldolase